MKKFFFIFTITFITLPVFCGIHLDEAVKKGIELNFELKNIGIESKIIDKRMKIAESGKVFKIDLKGNYLFRSEKIEMNLPDITIHPGLVFPGVTMEGGAFNNFDLYFSIIQPIYTGNILTNSIKLKEVEKLLNNTGRELKIIEISNKIKTTYFTFRLLKNEKRSLEIILGRVEVHLATLQDLYKEGLVRRNEILETELKAGEMVLKKEEIDSLINSVSKNFHELCGYEISMIDPDYSESIREEKVSMEFFIQNHPQFRIFSTKEKVLKLKKKIAQGQRLPHLNGFAEVHYGKPGINFFQDQWNSWFQGGINLNFNLFNSGKYGKEKNIIVYEKEKLKNIKKDLISKIRTKLSDLYQNHLSLKRKLKVSEKLVVRSEEESDIKKKLFEERQVSNSEYLTSLLNVKKYRSMKNKIELQIQKTKVSINSLIGKEGGK
ncbi:MAG: TolC family protein [Acidobacteriota bacterium]